MTTLADKLNKAVDGAIAIIGDAVSEQTVIWLARTIDRHITIRFYENKAPAGNDYQFEITFSDGSSASFDAQDMEG